MQSMLVALRAILFDFKSFRLIFFVFLGCIVAGKAFSADECNLISHFLAPFASQKYNIQLVQKT